MTSYASQWPVVEVDTAFKRYYEQFYQISDTPDAHEKYVQQFTHDATLIMASREAKGSEQILALRKSLWEKVQSRKHYPVKIFPFGPNSNEVMIYGTVDYVLKGGGKSSVGWAARAILTKDGDAVKMQYYQVYLDTAAQATKSK